MLSRSRKFRSPKMNLNSFLCRFPTVFRKYIRILDQVSQIRQFHLSFKDSKIGPRFVSSTFIIACTIILMMYEISSCSLQSGGAGSEVWNRVYMIAPVKKFGRVRLSTNFPSKQIWRSMRTWKDDEFLLGFTFYGVQTSTKRFS